MAALFLSWMVFGLQRNSGSGSQTLNRLRKAHILIVLNEPEDVASLVASKAVKNLLMGLTLKLGVFSLWKGQSVTKVPTSPF